jgi:hypothetical protein
LGVKKAPRVQKTECGPENQYYRVTYLSIGNFTWNKKKLELRIECWSILKEKKNKIVFKFSKAITFWCILLKILIYIWNMIRISTKKFSFMIAIENLKTILFFSFKIDQHSKIASLFFAFESDENFITLVSNRMRCDHHMSIFSVTWFKINDRNC